MTRIAVHKSLEALGLKDHGTSNHRTRAVFHYRPLIRLYKLEIPSLFGFLLRDEGLFLDRADPALFQVELDDLLTEFGPLIWPPPGQGPRDHLLRPAEGSRYTSDLEYPRDKDILIKHLRNLILSKQAKPNVDTNALIQKTHQDARHIKLWKEEDDWVEMPKRKAEERSRCNTAAELLKGGRKGFSADSKAEILDGSRDESSDSDAPLINRNAQSRVRFRAASSHFRVALRLCQKPGLRTPQQGQPCRTYGTIFLDNKIKTASECFDLVDQNNETECTYLEFHPPEDMTLVGRIRIDRGTKEANDTFEYVMSMFRRARRFPGGPSYRTLEVEVDFAPLPGQ